MTYRIGWLSPFTGASGVGTFSHAVTQAFPRSYQGEAIDLTILHPAHPKLYRSDHRCIQIEDTANFKKIMPIFDLLIYNIGNNCEHHELIFKLLSMHPGIVICHDYVFQHYLARRSMQNSKNFSSYGALLMKYGDGAVPSYIKRSRITSRDGGILYSPWDSEYSVLQPLSEVMQGLGSALVLHSIFAHQRAASSFAGPVIKLGMPYDQKRVSDDDNIAQWGEVVVLKRVLHLVSFGHIQSTKCIDQIISAIAGSTILRHKIRYTIAGFAGDPGYYSELQEMVSTLSMRDVVTFETDVSEDRLGNLIHEADIFVNLRRPNTEGSSASLIEQLETGKPVIVLDSGSYAEVPESAAVKLSADAGPNDIGAALEQLVARPEMLLAIGRAGQAYARSWSCESYAAGLLRFTFENRALLQARARILSARPAVQVVMANDLVSGDIEWQASLARARKSLRYLDKNTLALDPEILMNMQREALCTYVAQVIFGMFNKPKLQQALMRFFATRDRQRIYWGCVTFSLVADAVFDGIESARQRLLAMPANFDLQLWEIIEQLPPQQFLAAAHLLLPGTCPISQEQAVADGDIQESRVNRSRVLELLETLPVAAGPGAEQLKRWLEEPPPGHLDEILPIDEQNFSADIGNANFRSKAVLWGFHRMEADHAWMRGRCGFIGLRLGKDLTNIALRVKHVDASQDAPCTIGLSDGTSQAEIEVFDIEPHWIELNITPGTSKEGSARWLRLTTSHASPPPNSADTRILGCCIQRLEVSARSIKPVSDLEKILLNGNH